MKRGVALSLVSADDRIEALHDADRLWELGIMEDQYRRTRGALAINYLKVFSLTQLAAIARVSKKDLLEAGAVEYAEKAGKLNPESIKTLRLLYARYRTCGSVSLPLVAIALRDGTSLQAIHHITGIPRDELEEN